MDNYIFLNGEILPLKKVFISINDRGLLYGDGFFETFRSFKDNFLDFSFHFARLINSAKFFKINIDFTEKDFLNAAKNLKKQNHLIGKDCYVRITVTRGVDPHGPSIKKDLKSTIFMEVKKLPQFIEDRSKKGVKATILYNFKKEKNILYNYKTLNYLPSIIGFINKKTFDDVIFIDKFNNLIEGITANLFFYKGKTIYTTNEDDLILKGVTRNILIKSIKKFPEYRFNIRFKNITFKDLRNFDGAFMTNSLSIIYPVLKIEDYTLKHREDILNKLQEMYFKFLK